MNLKTKTVCIVDNGLFVDFARRIAPAFGKCYYHNPTWKTYAPQINNFTVGEGFDEIEVLHFPLSKVDDIDLWVFLDLYSWDLQCFLEDHGARVWGGRRGEEMELYRWEFKQALKKLGLPVQHVERVIGLEELRKLLRTKNNKFIKNSISRGDFESFRHESIELSQPRLDELGHLLGPTASDYEFVVEDEIPDAVEIGYDGFTVDGQFPSHAMMGVEVKDVGMIAVAKPYGELAAPVLEVNKVLANPLKGYNYRGFLCTEVRYGKDHKAYLIDPCCRLGTPSNELLQELFDGWPTVLWEGANGVLVSPTVTKKFGVLAVIHSEWASENWQALRYPKELDQWVKLRFHCRVEGVDYTVPQVVGNPYPGCVVGTGETLLEAVKICKERACEVKGYGVRVDLESIDKAMGVIEEGEKQGIKFADKLPSAEAVRECLS